MSKKKNKTKSVVRAITERISRIPKSKVPADWDSRYKWFDVTHTTNVTMSIFAETEKEAENEMRTLASRSDTAYLTALLSAKDNFKANNSK